MAGLPLTWLDVFTSTPLAGNGLAVVHDADGLDDATMLRVARETSLSETTFVQTPTEAGADSGIEMGRPSRLDAVVVDDGARVSGDCVVVLEGDLVL